VGDVSTHGLVFEEIRQVLADRVPYNEAIYIELGNWLTDLSQLRDPFAMIGAKSSVWARVPELGKRLVREKLVANFNELFGAPVTPDQRHGALARYFEQIALAATIERFVPEGIAESEIIRVFRRRFTQYYPHEHLDFPPWPFGSALGNRTLSGRSTLAELERQLRYVAEGLTIVEQQWARARSVEQRRDALAAHGHLSHAIEDFFFHSNFVEIARLHRLRTAHGKQPEGDPAPAFWDWFAGHALEDEDGAKLPREARRFFRRLLAPAGSGRTLSPTGSEAGFNVVYTGAFGATDVFHTFADALGGLGGSLEKFRLPDAAGRPVALVLPEYILDPVRRRSLVNDSTLDSAIAAHDKQVADEIETPILDGLVALGRLRPASGEAIKAAYAIDRVVQDKYPLSVGGFLLRLAQLVEIESEKSETVAARLDASKDLKVRVLDVRTDNGASAETVGSHTLMAKDSEAKQPLRGDAVTLATYAASFVADLMATTVGGGRRNVDWLKVLRHLIRYPSRSGGGWHAEVLERASFEWQGPPLPVSPPAPDPPLLRRIGTLTDRPRITYVSPDVAAARRQDGARVELEKAYRELERPAELAWRALVEQSKPPAYP
jgi:hypothetical protein